jgi:hypothetical protein
MRDLDLLVQKDDAQKATQSLERIGYHSESGFYPTDQHLPMLWLAGAPSALELHTDALSFSARKILPTQDVWQHAVRHETDDGMFFTLPDEWQLLIGMLHHQVSDRGHARRLLAIKALWEFASLGHELPETGWRVIVDHMASHKQLDLLGSFAAQAERLFGLACPSVMTISPAARAHAAKSYARAFQPYALRRGYFLADQFRFGFSRETMAVRYGVEEMSLGTIGRHLAFLKQHYRGQILRRLTGRGDRLS